MKILGMFIFVARHSLNKTKIYLRNLKIWNTYLKREKNGGEQHTRRITLYYYTFPYMVYTRSYTCIIHSVTSAAFTHLHLSSPCRLLCSPALFIAHTIHKGASCV